MTSPSFPTNEARLEAWSSLYRREGHRWGMVPSLCAHLALADCSGVDSKPLRLIDIGCGYGRDLAFFQHVFATSSLTGMDGSSAAITMARSQLPGRRLIEGDFLDLSEARRTARFDIVYSNYFLHLLSERELGAGLRIMRDMLKRGGKVIASFVSVRDRHYGRGRRIAHRCYETRSGLPWRFVDETELESLFSRARLKVVEITPYSEIELVGGQPDRVESFYTVATNR